MIDRTADRDVKVLCYAGYRGAQHPTFVEIGKRRYRITQTRRTWRDPEFEYFRVELENGQRLLLSHTLDREDWTITEEP